MTLLCASVLPLVGGVARADGGLRVAVLPVSLLAAPPSTGDRVRARLGQALADEYGVQLVPAAEVEQAVDAACGELPRWDCLEQEPALLAIGRALDAQVVVAGNLAVMGDSQVLKLRVVDLSAETVSGEVVEMTGANDDAVLARFVLLNERLFPRARVATESAPWPVWAGVGAGMLAVASLATLGVLLATGTLALPGGGGDWDARVSLP